MSAYLSSALGVWVEDWDGNVICFRPYATLKDLAELLAETLPEAYGWSYHSELNVLARHVRAGAGQVSVGDDDLCDSIWFECLALADALPQSVVPPSPQELTQAWLVLKMASALRQPLEACDPMVRIVAAKLPPPT